MGDYHMWNEKSKRIKGHWQARRGRDSKAQCETSVQLRAMKESRGFLE